MTTTTRLDILPDIPSVGEFVPGYEGIGWKGIGAPQDAARDRRQAQRGDQRRPLQSDL